MTPQLATASTLVLAAALPIGSWLILLLVGRPEPSLIDGAIAQLTYTFSPENPSRGWFIWYAVLPVLIIGLALTYLSALARRRRGASILFATVLALLFLNLYLAPVVGLVLAAPAIFGFFCIRGTRTGA